MSKPNRKRQTKSVYAFLYEREAKIKRDRKHGNPIMRLVSGGEKRK